ncbi:alpha-glucosidase [Lactobacillus mulieris]|uniref:Alpha-glucosidase n=1 Tax=Lactobacillus mulieris TaxID=2508708 RepID=A0AAW5WYL8_9LACO|nr:alpha-glucosidase [Lactobacillus mulieris]MCZ3621701.1 alpha-glucosidase [Lactobacillus mulieris]MCZ3623023.1 alpha-glucosidase [Lactobacillus mulieris]MCZ3635708.1 alpha-glucosidase [Lactobacillus mulieris]MCZ3690107.1 alpha-glucosidase [Lactobacillus mulieris]MCZ3696045.1 alpha-glucosidase [Lactobacillus mulieris]
MTNLHHEIFYQIYPASFKDDNNDGTGDLQGIISKLPYLKDLGITFIWLSPVYKSPMVDNGYDISDYQDINPLFGTMEDMEVLINKAHELNIKIMMDLVINHTSDQHLWFQKALKDPNSKYRNFYIFKKGINGVPPNNWRSNFGAGSAWEKVPNSLDEYYLHVFSKHQPDLNWENPALREEIYKIINWWINKGIDGFRIDAITFLKKDQDFASLTADGNDGLVKVKYKTENRPGLDTFLKELKTKGWGKVVTVGETSGLRYDQFSKFIGKDGYFSMAFDFHYIDIDVKSGSEWYRTNKWNTQDLFTKICDSQSKINKVPGGWAANFLENHDQPRSINKFIKSPKFRNEIGAKALATLFFFLRGAPFIYQGQELGMLNVKRTSIKEFNDVSSLNNYQRALEEGFSKKEALTFVNNRSRDNGRVPFQWDSSDNHGFNQGAKPWLKYAETCPQANVDEELKSPDSVLNFYKHLINLRKRSDLEGDLVEGEFKQIDLNNDNVVAYYRGKCKVIVSFSDKCQRVAINYDEVLSNNYKEIAKAGNLTELKPYQALVVRSM